jgi:acyl-CoA synthetase (NDP forming)
MSNVADLYFRPKSVVVYGASSNPDKLSGRPLSYLKRFEFPGGIYAVNPHRDEVQGVKSYADVASIPGTVDLAVVVVPVHAVLDAIRSCAAAGVRAATIFASGFAEQDEDGSKLQSELQEISKATGIRILGPNCLGSFSAPDKAFATFSTAFDGEGERPDSPIALVSQSGAVGTFTYTTINTYGLGVRYYANTGNEADLTSVDFLSDLVEKPDVDILMGHLEGVKDLEALSALTAKAAAADKPLILLKSGRTEAGARAVGKHTASVAGDDQKFNEILSAHGAVRVPSMEAWADAALAFSKRREVAGRKLSVLTLSGGAGALAADRAVDQGLQVDTWSSAADREELAAQLPAFASVQNPIDLTGAMINDLGLLASGLDLLERNEDTDAVLVLLGNADKGSEEIVATLVDQYAKSSKPFIVVWTGGSGKPRLDLLAQGVPTYTEPNRAVDALSRVIEYSLHPARKAVAVS